MDIFSEDMTSVIFWDTVVPDVVHRVEFPMSLYFSLLRLGGAMWEGNAQAVKALREKVIEDVIEFARRHDVALGTDNALAGMPYPLTDWREPFLLAERLAGMADEINHFHPGELAGVEVLRTFMPEILEATPKELGRHIHRLAFDPSYVFPSYLSRDGVEGVGVRALVDLAFRVSVFRLAKASKAVPVYRAAQWVAQAVAFVAQVVASGVWDSP